MLRNSGSALLVAQGLTVSDDKAPRWLVRWLITVFLLVVVAGIGYVIYWELTFPERVEAQAHQGNRDLAKQVALMQSDPQKERLLTTTALLVCAGQ